MLEGMNNVWIMALGWIIGFFVLVVSLLSLVKIVKKKTIQNKPDR
jgi:hypothetical protein